MADVVRSPNELFSRCEEYGKSLNTEQAYASLIEISVQEITFRTIHPLRYGDLIQLLRSARDSETQWFLLAVWMKQKNIRQPKDFLPAEIYNKLTKDVRKKFRGMSPRDGYFFNLVETWTPYFERLIADFRAIKEKNRKAMRSGTKGRRIDPTENLLRAGYESHTIPIVGKKRSAVAAAYEWLAHRGYGNEYRIRNAHSLIRSYLSKRGHNVPQLIKQFREEAGFITKT
jgi:hypothetical protein